MKTACLRRAKDKANILTYQHICIKWIFLQKSIIVYTQTQKRGRTQFAANNLPVLNSLQFTFPETAWHKSKTV